MKLSAKVDDAHFVDNDPSNLSPPPSQVLRALDSEGNLSDLSNGVKYGQSTIYNSSQYSADIQNFRRMAFESDVYSSEYDHSDSHDQRNSSHK